MPEKKSTPRMEDFFVRGEEFSSLYANNVYFEPSVWDLKIIFGELNQSLGKETVNQHTAITIPWTTAKLMSYFLQTQLIAYEIENSTIKIPAKVLPVALQPLPDDLKDDPTSNAIMERVRELRDRLIADSK